MWVLKFFNLTKIEVKDQNCNLGKNLFSWWKCDAWASAQTFSKVPNRNKGLRKRERNFKALFVCFPFTPNPIFVPWLFLTTLDHCFPFLPLPNSQVFLLFPRYNSADIIERAAIAKQIQPQFASPSRNQRWRWFRSR